MVYSQALAVRSLKGPRLVRLTGVLVIGLGRLPPAQTGVIVGLGVFGPAEGQAKPLVVRLGEGPAVRVRILRRRIGVVVLRLLIGPSVRRLHGARYEGSCSRRSERPPRR